MGVCPDVMVQGSSCSDNVYNVSGSLSSEQQCVLFSRRLLASEYNIVSED